jgi:hypothetical protein
MATGEVKSPNYAIISTISLQFPRTVSTSRAARPRRPLFSAVIPLALHRSIMQDRPHRSAAVSAAYVT